MSKERDELHEKLKKLVPAQSIGEVFGLIDGYAVVENPGGMIAPPVPMVLFCPQCHARHIDGTEFVLKAHHTHACQTCGMVWRPAIVNTVGVQFLPGFKDGAS